MSEIKNRSPERVLVTGAVGFIGSYLVERLLANGIAAQAKWALAVRLATA